jgi:DNA ligase (NAD+)
MNKIEQIKNLTKELLQYCREYYVFDSPTISDTEYDKKFDTLKQLEDEANFWLANSPTRKVQGEVLPYLEKVRHSVPMLSADKSTDIEDVKKFIGNKAVVASFKADGGTVVVKYQNGKLIQGLSRGSGTDGESITHTVRMIKNLPLTIPYKEYLEIRGEALIPWEDYNTMNSDGTLGHPRNVASGGLRQLNANEAAKRNIYFYAFTLVNWNDVGVKTKQESLDFLANNGFDVVPNILIPSVCAISIEEALDYLDREECGFPTDGWCFEYNDLAYGESLGSTEHHDRRLYALKPNRTEYTTRFCGVEYRTCRTGIVSLTAVFEPVEIDNTLVTKATLHNYDYFNNLKLGEGDEIVVAKMNEIIPAVLGNNTRSGTYKLIDKCPSCGKPLIIKNTGTANVLYCPNENCPSRKISQFVHFVSKNCMDIKGLSEATLSTLISLGYINDFKSIFHLSDHKNEIIQLDGFGTKSVQKLLLAIEKSRDVKLANFIAALGIPNIGLSAAKTISKFCNGDYERFAGLYSSSQMGNFSWTILDDFGEVMASSIHRYLEDNLFEIDDLALEMRFVKNECKQVVNNPFNGKTLCVTGKLNHFTRDSINEKIASLGAKAASSVSKKTDYLITNEQSGSSKYKKAVELNISIITEKEFLEMCGE